VNFLCCLLMASTLGVAVGPEPLNYVSDNAVVLHDGWRIQTQALAGEDGAAISQPGFDAAKWFTTTAPTTVLGALVRHGVYPDPYVGTNNMLIPDASDDHNRRFDLAKFSHLPDKSNPWWFRTEFDMPRRFAGKIVWLNLDGLNYRADIWSTNSGSPTHATSPACFSGFASTLKIADRQ